MAHFELSRRTVILTAGALAIAPFFEGVGDAAVKEGMFRYISLAVRAEGMSRDDFAKAFLAQARAAEKLEGIARLVFCEIVPGPSSFPPSKLELDGILEVWIKREHDFETLLGTRSGKKWWADTNKLFSRNTTYFGREHIFVRPPQEGETVRAMSLLARKDGWTHRAFVKHWLGIHGPMGTKIDGLVGFALTEVLRTDLSKGEKLMPECDGIAEIWGTPKITPFVRSWFADGDIFIQREKSYNYYLKDRVAIA